MICANTLENFSVIICAGTFFYVKHLILPLDIPNIVVVLKLTKGEHRNAEEHFLKIMNEQTQEIKRRR